ncbi:MAG: hypothetical protein DRH90_17670 [Deltaproteobacteria bacterium]|nr:MAG: hypothetical protein DRH90_17670 [Deltaproteobacteria bacterium]RLC12885.1 MAG: hypothetical protein DRI24_16820 [Deltaproteobacteria bacterium]
MFELRFIERSVEIAPSSDDIGALVRTVRILQQRIKTGTYSAWGSWHDVPLVEVDENEGE